MIQWRNQDFISGGGGGGQSSGCGPHGSQASIHVPGGPLLKLLGRTLCKQAHQSGPPAEVVTRTGPFQTSGKLPERARGIQLPGRAPAEEVVRTGPFQTSIQNNQRTQDGRRRPAASTYQGGPLLKLLGRALCKQAHQSGALLKRLLGRVPSKQAASYYRAEPDMYLSERAPYNKVVAEQAVGHLLESIVSGYQIGPLHKFRGRGSADPIDPLWLRHWCDFKQNADVWLSHRHNGVKGQFRGRSKSPVLPMTVERSCCY